MDPQPTGSRYSTRLAKPYSVLAPIYDRVLGDAFFADICASFDDVVRRYSISFRSAADIGCGTGTFASYLARRGAVVFAVDRSSAMLRVAAAKIRRNNIRFLQQDLKELRLPQPVELITCNHDTLNYLLLESDLRKAFTRFRENLGSGGHLIFDVIVQSPNQSDPQIAVQRIVLPNVRATWRTFLDPQTGLSVVKMDFAVRPSGGGIRRFIEMHMQRWYSVSTVESLLDGSGLKLLGIHDGEDVGAAVMQTTPWLRFVAQSK